MIENVKRFLVVLAMLMFGVAANAAPGAQMTAAALSRACGQNAATPTQSAFNAGACSGYFMAAIDSFIGTLDAGKILTISVSSEDLPELSVGFPAWMEKHPKLADLTASNAVVQYLSDTGHAKFVPLK
jgi:hypothetical protein